MSSKYKPGLMDSVFLTQQLDSLAIENARRPADRARDDLLSTATRLEAEARRLGIADLIAVAFMRRSDILMTAERYLEALAALREARFFLGSVRQHDLLVYILHKQALAYSRLEDWTNVSAVCSEGIDVVERFRYKITGQYQQSSYLRFRIGLYTLGVRSACELGLDVLALERAEMAKCRSVLRYKERQVDENQSTTQIEKEFRQVSEKLDSIQRAGGKIPEALIHRRRTLWDTLCILRFQSKGPDSMAEFKLEAIQSSLDADEAVIYYFWIDPAILLICTVDREHFISEIRAISPQERQTLEAYAREVLEGGGKEMAPLQRVKTFADLLLPVKGRALLGGKRRLLFSPHKILHTIPFHALSWENRFLIESFAVSYVPNLSSLMFPFRPSAHRKVLALGVADYDVRGVQLAPLKEAEMEVADLEQIYKQNSASITVLRGVEAREERLHELAAEGKLSEFSCLHFATHGMTVESDTPMESHLFLRDSKLEALDIANWKLNAEVVVLSACCSGQRPISGRGMSEVPGDDLFGLQAAFFTAGAHSVLCSLWPVDSETAYKIMTGFHRRLAEGTLPELALQAALNEYLQQAGLLTRKVYYWAPFFLASVGHRPRNAKGE